MSNEFIETKTAEALAANAAGDAQGLAHALIEAIAENDAPFEQTVTDMTDAVRRQNGS
ncbi:hypothetical protein O3Q52_51660 [Streptomyces sp. ActVer]|uniref:hypothetical protein n=1 Tax=Streptomyces sp. ActVer TaxID=3014558 RepID=UPI0022B43CAD|nr:hypothetical protein [Streptomyces sp. ActVer]MCZ4516427.1 hypothetical protein [Streptomyces sp. ActVer]